MLTNVSEIDFQRAKNRFKFLLLTNLEDLNSLAINIAADVMYLGYVRSGQELCASIDKVTIEDLERVTKRILRSKPALTVIGDVKAVNPYSDVEKYFTFLRGHLGIRNEDQ